MPANKKPRKSYRQKYDPKHNSIFRFSAEVERNLQMVPHVLLEKLRTGEGGEPDWHGLAARLNLGVTIAYKLLDGSGAAEVKEVMDTGLAALKSCFDRGRRIGRWGFSGGELGAVSEALNLTDELQLKCTRRELRDMMRYVLTNAAVRATG